MAESMEDHLQCPTCLDVFRDPVMLPCSHNFCHACLQQWKDAGEQSCPVCRKEFRSMDIPLNLALKNLCENFPRASIKSEDICSMHQEELKLFCLDHREIVCIICMDSEIHVGHTFRPLKEIVKGHHEELKEGLQKAKERLQDYKDCRGNCNEQAKYIKVQRENVERKIKKDFEELRRFLDVEEEARLAAVREEEQKKSKIIKEKIVVLGQQMTALSDVIRSTEEQLASGNVSFLKNFKTAMSRIQEMPEKPQLLPGGLLDQWKDTGERSCPLCWTEFSLMDIPPNLALKNLCESFSLASIKSEDICSMHQEELKLFCMDHREIVCIICRDSEIHVGHTFQPLKEIVKGHHEELEEGLQKAKERLQDYKDCRENCNEQAEYIKIQRENVECKIKKDFEELRRFLDVEEEARLAAVREEEQKKSKIMKEKIVFLDRQMAALSNLIRSTEEELASGNVSFMKKFKTAMSRIQELPEKPQLLPGGLLDEAKHVGNLKFKVWERMKETLAYSPVILDPNTANPRISLSEDLTSLSWEDVEQERPKNPGRHKRKSVLGCALDLGRHVWDVEVGDNDFWHVGVAWGNPCLPERMNHKIIGFHHGKYQMPGGKYGEWNPPVKVQRIRVEVDMNERSLSFSEPLTNTKLWNCEKLCNWLDLSGSAKMHPYFLTNHGSHLKIVPIPPVLRLPSVSGHVDKD
nr:E3 ubiquitin-protein ligase TRIM39-like [Nerophis lumbriciformis]